MKIIYQDNILSWYIGIPRSPTLETNESTWVLVVMFVVEVTDKLTFKLKIVSAQTFNVTHDDYQKIVNGGKRYSRAQIRAGTISW